MSNITPRDKRILERYHASELGAAARLEHLPQSQIAESLHRQGVQVQFCFTCTHYVKNQDHKDMGVCLLEFHTATQQAYEFIAMLPLETCGEWSARPREKAE